jgi:glycosyltransferase involved in cell wall biosynthesis
MSAPPVCVLTPVYNGAEYLPQCVESVLAQDYPALEYTIVDNCSTDATAAIAKSYAVRDSRVRVVKGDTFVSAIANHNRAFALVPEHCKYCKVVSADDWITPDCIRKLVDIAELHPSVGLVGCYQRSGDQIKWQGMPHGVTFLPGREAARLGLLRGVHVLGTPTSVLYRADLVRGRTPFFPHDKSYADTSACYECFKEADFGFVHDVLSVERVHHKQWSNRMDRVAAGSVGYLDVLQSYGPAFMTCLEFQERRSAAFSRYYRFLGGCLLKLRGPEFWRFQADALRECGCSLEWSRVGWNAVKEVLEESRQPARAGQKAWTVIMSKVRNRVRV